MSSIPTKQIDGDVAVGRNVNIGGKAEVKGSVTVGHNLKVKGWLDAPNIKGANKGLFKSATQLREAYPTPEEGWWALVGDSLPAQVYMADNGFWVAQTDSDGAPKFAGNPTVDSAVYLEAVEQMGDDLEEVKIKAESNRTAIEELRDTTLKTLMLTLDTQVDINENQEESIGKLKQEVENVGTTVDRIDGKIGEPGGIATLDEQMKLSAGQIPGRCVGVVVFETQMSFRGALADTGAAHDHMSEGAALVYNMDSGRFILLSGGVAYGVWPNSDEVGSATPTGVVPVAGKLYVSRSALRGYLWDGEALVELGIGSGALKSVTPVACVDEEELAAKAASDEWPVGQQFYIAEE